MRKAWFGYRVFSQLQIHKAPTKDSREKIYCFFDISVNMDTRFVIFVAWIAMIALANSVLAKSMYRLYYTIFTITNK